MYVNPQGTVKILRNVGWHSDLKHTRLFPSESAQLTYMNGRVKHTFVNNFTYIREQKVLRVPINAEQLYDCNYLMFMNVGFGSKWFYAFITDVKYLNPETSEITFEIDQFQTWWFQINLGKCFVEREHVADDSIGRHTLDEGLELGEHLIQAKWNYYFGSDGAGTNNRWKIKLTCKPSIVTQAILQMTPIQMQMGDWFLAHNENQYYLATTYEAEMYNNPSIMTDIERFLNNQSKVGNELISVECFPSTFSDSQPITLHPNQYGILRPAKFNMPSVEGTFEYKPKNNKMYCYPYMFLRVTNHEDGDTDFRWENFYNADDPEFMILHTLVNKVSCVLQATEYQNMALREGEIWINDFPTIPIGQNDMKGAMKSIGSLIGNALGAGASLATGNVGGTIGGIMGIANSAYSAMTTPSKVVGSPNKTLMLKYSIMGYSFYCMCIRPEYAKKIDDFFTRFGYRVDELKVPELTSRESFNYVKTKECDPSGNAPDEALRAVANMFNSGVTLWHVNDVGNTSLSNNIVSH